MTTFAIDQKTRQNFKKRYVDYVCDRSEDQKKRYVDYVCDRS